MTGLRRFHPAYSVQLMRRWLAVCLLPLLNALRAFDLAAFRAALWQEGALRSPWQRRRYFCGCRPGGSWSREAW